MEHYEASFVDLYVQQLVMELGFLLCSIVTVQRLFSAVLLVPWWGLDLKMKGKLIAVKMEHNEQINCEIFDVQIQNYFYRWC